MAKVGNYISSSFKELRNNVTWPEWSEAQRLTIVVTVFSVIFSLAIWGVDSVFEKVITGFFQLFQ